MGENSNIEWTTHTFNGWIGCTPLSPACDFCYAETLAGRYGWAEWGAGKPRKRTSAENWKKPLKWDRDAAASGKRPGVFSNSLSDWADPEVPDDWRRDLFGVIRQTPNLDWLLLTKRHALAMGYLKAHAEGLANIRIGMTVENDKMAATRLPQLRRIRAELGFPTFVSYEPALGLVDWEPWIGAIDWLIAGGESGPKARPPHPDWFRAARDICAKYGIPFFFKQWGDWGPVEKFSADASAIAAYCGEIQTLVRENAPDLKLCYPARDDGKWPALVLQRIGKKGAGAELDGVLHREFPR